MTWREAAIARLSGETFDLLVAGGGIIGARAAYEASRAGLTVALVDAVDFGAGASGASSKLIHGGFRYLRGGHLGLVRASLAERAVLARQVAPNLVWPLTCLLPVYEGRQPGAATVAAGLLAYRALALGRAEPAGLIGPREAESLVPGLAAAGLELAARWREGQTHDSRLVLATVRGAAAQGAVVLNHAPLVALERGAALVSPTIAHERPFEVRCRHMINATGAAVDFVRRLEDPSTPPLVRLSKGIHALLDLRWPWLAAVAIPAADGRVLVAQPWLGRLLIGTTDDEFATAAGPPVATEAEVRRLLDEAATVLAPELLNGAVQATFAGLRVLPLGVRDTVSAPREHVLSVGRLGMVSVAGGKLTTHRPIAVDALRRIPDPRLRGLCASVDRLPGTARSGRRSRLVTPAQWTHLERLYGEDAYAVAERGRERPELLEAIHPDGPDIWAQWEHAVQAEWAVDPDDVLLRRTTAGYWRGGVAAAPRGARRVAVAG